MGLYYVLVEKLGLLFTSGAVVTVWMSALKMLLVSLVQVGLTTVLIYVFFSVRTYMLEMVAAKILPLMSDFTMAHVVIELTGVGAWMADKLRLVECLSAVLSAMIITFIMRIVLSAK